MTNEEAIRYFKRHIDLYCVTGICREAEEAAIKALEQESCDDAISRQAAIEAVKQAIYNHDSALMRLTELPSVTQKSGKWIPVSERLPEEHGEYLITWTGILGEHSAKRTKPLIAIAEYEIYEPENYADWITTMYEFEHYHDIKVLAWMPLPEPFEPQESEGNE